MADGAFGLSKELAEETAPVWEKVKGLVTPLEWPEQAKLISEINALKKERDAVILAHNYMTPEIFHGVGDYVGDSLGLAKEAARSDAKVIVQAGVHFMAETSKILSPSKTVLIPEENTKDLQEIPENVKNGLEIVPVKWIDKVLEIALEKMPTPLPDEVPAVAAAATADAVTVLR